MSANSFQVKHALSVAGDLLVANVGVVSTSGNLAVTGVANISGNTDISGKLTVSNTVTVPEVYSSSVNSSLFTVGSYGSTVSGALINSMSVAIGNSSSNTYLIPGSLYINEEPVANSTGANNAFNLGGYPAASYLRTAGDFTVNGTITLNANAGLVFQSNAGLSANGSFGTAGHVLHTNGSSIYWAVDAAGVTSISTGNGISGGPITTTGTITAVPGTGTVVNSSGIHIDSTYVGTLFSNWLPGNVALLTANNTNNLGGQPAASYARLDEANTFAGGMSFGNGISFGSVVTTNTSLTRHIDLYSGAYGFGISANRLNIKTGSHTVFLIGSTDYLSLNTTSLNLLAGIGITANNTKGTAGQVLKSNGTGVYWGNDEGITSITAGDGLSGGVITSSGTLSVNSAFISGIVVNNATYFDTASWAAPKALGGTTPNTAVFTNATVQNSITFSGYSGKSSAVMTMANGGYLDWSNTGIAAPGTSGISNGSKLLLWSNSSAAMSIGLEGSALWQSVPLNSNYFKTYHANTLTLQVNSSNFTANVNLLEVLGNITGNNTLTLRGQSTSLGGKVVFGSGLNLANAINDTANNTFRIEATGGESLTSNAVLSMVWRSNAAIETAGFSYAVNSANKTLSFGNTLLTSPNSSYSYVFQSGNTFFTSNTALGDSLVVSSRALISSNTSLWSTGLADSGLPYQFAQINQNVNPNQSYVPIQTFNYIVNGSINAARSYYGQLHNLKNFSQSKNSNGTSFSTEFTGMSIQLENGNSSYSAIVNNTIGSQVVNYVSNSSVSTNISGIFNYIHLQDSAFSNSINGIYSYALIKDAAYANVYSAFSATVTANGTQNNPLRLYYGGYINSANSTGKYGLYITGENRNYLSSNLGLNVLNPTSRLHVFGTSNLDGVVYTTANLNIDDAGAIVIAGNGSIWANNTKGTAGQVLKSDANGVYWDTDLQGVTQVSAGTGLSGGPITTTGSLSVNASYIATLTSNNANNLLGLTWASPGAIGSITPNTGIFTTLSLSGNLSSSANVTTSASFISPTTTCVINASGNAFGAAIFSGGTGALLFDDGYHKRITWNDATGNFIMKAGAAYSSSAADEVYIKGISEPDSGAARIRFDNLSTNGQIFLSTAPVGVANSVVAWTDNIIITTTFIQTNVGGTLARFTANGLGIGNTAPNHNLSINGTTFVNTSVTVGNSSINAVINSTAFSGTSNNSSYLGGIVAANYARTDISETFNSNITLSNTSSYLIDSGRAIIGTVAGQASQSRLSIQDLAFPASKSNWGSFTEVAVPNAEFTATRSYYSTQSSIYNYSLFANAAGSQFAGKIFGGYFQAFNGNSVSSNSSSAESLVALNGYSWNYSKGTGNNNVVSLYSTYGIAGLSGNATATNIYSGVFKTTLQENSKSLSSCMGVRSSISIETSETIPVTYLYYGIIEGGANVTSSYGAFLSGEEKNYFSGNVGIGITSPTSKLHVVGTANLNGEVYALANVNIANTNLVLGSSSKAANGYSYLPSGLKMNWGVMIPNTSSSVTFTSSFATACISVQVTPQSLTHTGANTPYVSAVNTTVATIRSASTTTTGNVFYLAIGY